MPVASSNPEAFIIGTSEEWASLVKSLLARVKVDVVEWNRTGQGWQRVWLSVRPSITVVDLVIVKRDGITCMKALRAMDAQASILFTHPFSGLYANEIEVNALGAGASAVLQIPFPEQRFLKSAMRLLIAAAKSKSLRKTKIA